MKEKFTRATLDAIAAVKSANPEFMAAAIYVFDPNILPETFLSCDVAEILLTMKNVPPPTDWRVMGALIIRAENCGLIETTGKMGTRRVVTKAHTCNHEAPYYRLTDPFFWMPPKKIRKKWRELKTKYDGDL